MGTSDPFRALGGMAPSNNKEKQMLNAMIMTLKDVAVNIEIQIEDDPSFGEVYDIITAAMGDDGIMGTGYVVHPVRLAHMFT